MANHLQDAASISQFELRKQQHIDLALDNQHQAIGHSALDKVQLIHEAIPDLNFNTISTITNTLGFQLPAPFFISSMTAGHAGSVNLNQRFAEACQASGWLFAVGSQRRELDDQDAQQEWRQLRKLYPNIRMLGNIGLSQLIATSTDQIQRLNDNLQATAMIIHTNPLQEALQPEGTPCFKGGYQALERLCKELPCPVILKETGCGFSTATLQRLNHLGLAAIDISGLGGTHWGRIEGARAKKFSVQEQAAHTYKNWGISTVQSLLNAMAIKPNFEVWASGGVRTGLDAAKLLALGGNMIGVAQPMLISALESPEALQQTMASFTYELKIALFCTGHANISSLQASQSCQILL